MKFRITENLVKLIILFASANAIAASIEPPKAELVDEFGINLVDGQVTRSIQTVSIGGERGLSHAVTMQTNHFTTSGKYGYGDSFEGYAKYTQLGEHINWDSQTSPAYIMKVWGPGGMAQFAIYVDGSRKKNASSYTGSNYSYVSLGDERHKLEVNSNNELIWTLPDGTVNTFQRGGSLAKSGGTLRKITYPNGFEVKLKAGGGVHTNTGFQLFYGYEPDNRPASSTTISKFGTEGFGSTKTYSSDIWARKNPAFIKALNNTVEYCRFQNISGSLSDNQLAAQCRNKTNNWPTAEIDWPAGMPLAFYAEENDLVITDAGGGQTVLHFTPYDLTKRNPTDPHFPQLINVPGQLWWSPRLTAVTPPGANEPVWEYAYNNAYYADVIGSGIGIHSEHVTMRLSQNAGIIRWAWGPNGEANYGNMGVPTGPWDNEVNNTGLYKNNSITRRVRVKTGMDEDAPESIWEAYVQDDAWYFYDIGGNTHRGFIRYADYFHKGREDYEYSIRDNLTKITYQKDASNETYSQASYPASCPDAERKRCNNPTWIKDQNGNVTDYTYHQQSGQVLTETGPADENGVRPQTRYEYAQYNARYYNPYDEGTLGQLVQGSPIWLLKKESYCRKSAATSNGCTASNDQVVTEYDYGPTTGPNNLLLRGIKVTAEGEPSRLTCFTYDIYGNQIGVTTPKADKTSCY